MRNILQSDINDILSDDNIAWEELRNSTILVTGATGLIGGLLTRILSEANERYGLNIRLVGHGRNREKGEALEKELRVEFVYGDIGAQDALGLDSAFDVCDYIFHCAAMTSSAEMVARPVDVMMSAAGGTRHMLELAREKQCKGFVYLSSMEVYGRTSAQKVREDALGYLDLSNSRSSYPESKRYCEMLCVAYAAQYGVPAKIARLARTFGAGVPNDPSDMRVANQFARKALAGEDIELHTEGRSVANCCYTADAMTGILAILLKGRPGEAYTIANPAASVTIREMAGIVANDVCGGEIKVLVNIPDDIKKRGYAPDVGHTLVVDKLEELGWKPKVGIAEMYRRMIEDWQSGE